MRLIFCSASAMTIAIALLAAPANAQTAAPPAPPPAEAAPTDGIADIVVTAQKRAENVQDVPISITAFTAAALQERAVASVSQLSNITPNVTLDGGTPFSGSTAVLSAFIRGIGSDDFAFNIDPGVGIYVDGVYLARTVGANQDLLDVDRIEILKGPQGTLFGRNTIGGAISIVTRDPGDHFRFTGDVTTGSYRLLQARGSVDVPLADNLFSSFTFGIKNRQGYVQRIPYPDQRTLNTPAYTSFASSDYGTNSREGGNNNFTLRGKLKWNGGNIRATLTGDYSYEDSSGIANKLLDVEPNVPGNFAGTSNLPGTAFDPTGTTGFLFAGLYNFCIGATPGQIAARGAQALCGATGTQYRSALRLPGFGSVNVDGNPLNDRLPYDNRFVIANPDQSYATGNDFSKLENWGLAGTIEADIAPHMTIKSITAYRRTSWKSGQDADGSPLNFLQLSFDQRQQQFSQELQLLGKAFDGKLNYVLGGYYFREKGTLHDYVTFAEGLLQVDGPNSFDTENYAAFGQIDYRPIDLIGITIGGRYTHEKKLFEGGQQDLNGFNYKLFGCSDANGNITPNGPFPLAPITCQQGLDYPNAANPIQVYAPGVNRKAFSNFSPKVGIQLHPAQAVMVYASWSKGYKTGGWTTRLTNPQLTAQDFNEEKATTWEVGVKS
ncbi:MAG: TonB-dependent receptor, partial [Sphingomonas sp.]